MVTSLVLVRHGQSTWNVERRWQGEADPPLSEVGRAQARFAAIELSRQFPAITTTVTSPQLRALQTAELLLTHGPGKASPSFIERVDDLRERSVGPWSGLTTDDIEQRFPGFIESGRRPEGFEPDGPLFDRVHRALLGVARQRSDAHVVVVCHGGVINALVRRLTDETGRVPNLSGWTARVEGSSIELLDRFDLLEARDRTGGDSPRN
jgi:probable phosphoglycerate mutase